VSKGLIRKELFDYTPTILTLLGGYSIILFIINPSTIILVIITNATLAGAVEVAAVKTAVKIIITLLLKIITIIIKAKIIRVKIINPIN